MNVKNYICYDNRDDTILAIGTAKECAKQLGMTVGSFHSQKSSFKNRHNPNYVKRNKRLDIFEIED